MEKEGGIFATASSCSAVVDSRCSRHDGLQHAGAFYGRLQEGCRQDSSSLAPVRSLTAALIESPKRKRSHLSFVMACVPSITQGPSYILIIVRIEQSRSILKDKTPPFFLD